MDVFSKSDPSKSRLLSEVAAIQFAAAPILPEKSAISARNCRFVDRQSRRNRLSFTTILLILFYQRVFASL